MVGRTPEFLGKKIEKPEIVLVSLDAADPSAGDSRAAGWSVVAPYGAVLDRQCGDARLLRSALRLHHFRRQQRLRLRRTECQYALVQFGDRHRHPARPLSADHLPDGGGGIGGGETHGAFHRGTLRTDTLKFGAFWLGTILVVGALTFFPALVLGPIAEFFAMKSGLLF